MMALISTRIPFAVSLFLASTALAADDDKLKDYLVDIGPGAVGAHDILGLPNSVVSNMQVPKDFIAAINTASGAAGKTGIGIAFTPARSGIKLLATGIVSYQGNALSRLWGNTTFSYAQAAKSIGGVEYQQQAIAVQTGYFLRSEDDPLIAVRAVFEAPGACPKLEALTSDHSSFEQQVKDRVAERSKELNRPLTGTEKEKILADLDQSAGTKNKLMDIRAAAVTCASDRFAAAKSKWNKSQLGLTLGQGWIRNPAGGLGRTSLGRHIAVTLAWAPPGWDNSLFNVTARRVSREVDTSTLAGTPVFKSSSLAAVRYTYGYGNEQDTFLIAELSNAKANKPTEANTAFKSALGIDRRVGKGVWLEMRAGRSQSLALGKAETKVLFNLKLSPEASLPTLGGN